MAGRDKINMWIEIAPALTLYGILCSLWFPAFHYNIGTDGVCYLSIAQKYYRQDYANAINGYWSPLLSWLLQPFLFAELNPLLSIKILAIVLGGCCLFAACRMASALGLYRWNRLICLTALAVPMAIWGLVAIAADTLLLCPILLYLSIIFDPHYAKKNTDGITCGVLGALAYFAKAYAFPFFLFHFLVFNLIHYARRESGAERRTIVRHAVSGGMVFLLLCSFWVYPLSKKYEKLTIGTSGGCNHAWANPSVRASPDPIYRGLIPPSNDSAVSFWEDPTLVACSPWSPFESSEAFKNQILIIVQNCYELILCCQQFSWISVAIVLGSIVLLRYDRSIFSNAYFFSLLTCAIYVSGYLMIWLDFRHLYPIFILVYLSGFKLIHQLGQLSFHSEKWKQYLLGFVLIVSILVSPLKAIKNQNDNRENFALLAKELENVIPRKERIASNANWGKTINISYLNEYAYFGMPVTKQDIFLNPELKFHKIAYYLEWTDARIFPHSDLTIQQTSNCFTILANAAPVLKIYPLNFQ